jgi:hypothetical protein
LHVSDKAGNFAGLREPFGLESGKDFFAIDRDKKYSPAAGHQFYLDVGFPA